MDYRLKIKNKEELKKVIEQHKKKGDVIVQCHGCFDIIHPGHIRYLEFAKKQGNILVVSITCDKFIFKGDDRPYMPEELRINAMAALEFVDYVYLDNEYWAGPILKYLKPDIYIKGKEYEKKVSGGKFRDEKAIVEFYGGKVLFSSGDVVFSSSKLIENFKDKFALDFEVFDVFCKRNNITIEGLNGLISKFKNQKILIIGDVVVDEYNYSEIISVAGEAPMFTVRPLKKHLYIGSAGVISKHIKYLGGNPVLFSAVGNDYYGKYIRSNLTKDKIKFEFLTDNKIPTGRKVRFLADNQKLIKIDYVKDRAMSPKNVKVILNKIKKEHSNAGCIIFSDSGYGYISEFIREEVIAFGKKRNIPIIADTSGVLGTNISKYHDIFLISPTEKEARLSLDDKTSGLSGVACDLLEKTRNKNILITLGANGMLIFKNKTFRVYGQPEERHPISEYIPAIEKNALDPMGAGDAMLAILALSISAGSTLAESVYLGNITSYLEVNKAGNIPININEVLEFLESIKNKKDL